MAQKVTVELVDDLDGTTGREVRTVPFGFNGHAFEIDLSSANVDLLERALQPFIVKARRPKGQSKNGSVRARGVNATSRERNKTIRDWARRNGHKLAERGRIPARLIEEFDAARSGHQ